MTHADEAARMERELRDVLGGRVRVVPSPFAGVRVKVISERFAGLAPQARRERVDVLLPGAEIFAYELLTPEEAEFSGQEDLGGPVEPEDLPLWPEALAHGKAPEITVRFPSEDFGTLTAPVVSTFYSLRGGVGRSTALAHSARAIAAQGLTVLCVDMDLEAPGLASLFDVEGEVSPGTGVVPLLARAEVSGRIEDLDQHVLRVGDDGRLFLLPAGYPDAEYARLLSHLDPAAWYEEDEVNPLRLLVEKVSELSEKPDVVLIDSRTGISPLAAPLLFDVSDINVIAFYPHPQAKAGTRALTRALLAAKSRRSDSEGACTPEVRFVVSPVPATPEVRELYEERAQEWVGEWLSVARTRDGGPAFEALEEIIQVVSYREALAVSDSVVGVREEVDDYTSVAAWITGLVEPGDALGDVPEERGEPSKAEILATLEFAGETAESQDLAELRDTFLSTDDVDKALKTDIPVVIGRKGTGKTALFRRLAESRTAVVVTAPSGLGQQVGWTPDADLYSALDGLRQERGLPWRVVWSAFVGLVVLRARPQVPVPDWVEGPFTTSRSGDVNMGSAVYDDLDTLFTDTRAGLRVAEWLQAVDRSLPEECLLLFDGLDTGFGGTDEERRRRNDAVSGLLTMVNELGQHLDKLKFKVLLREDIWREAKLPNKSHLQARSVRLTWENKTDYLRVAIKQAWRSEPYRRLVTGRLNRTDFKLEKTPVEYWPENFVQEAWVLLASERISANSKTAYTDRWVWARLADANNDHSPRALAQIMQAALSRERILEEGSPYSRSIIRPKALVESLDRVSEAALDALKRDEFPELVDLLDRLETIKRTPFDASELDDADANHVRLARDVGLLEELSGSRDKVERYRVPELYRKALQMGRMGQA
ncbi:tyrosine-protein kinase family protein [Streptomyces sp. NPDC088674]|uniref:tyrosine-protein kinase family protein n=1 Tax=Streptomyces sp. NPDC088674 TaxID=3365869 RepID=UPI0038177001